MYNADQATLNALERVFSFHPPKAGQGERYVKIRELARDYAVELISMCPDSIELEYAMTKLQECVMFANAAIARNEK